MAIHKETEQGRTQESKTRGAQESKGGKAAEAPGVRARLEEAQSEEDGARPGEAVKATHLAFSIWHLASDASGLNAECQLLIAQETKPFGTNTNRGSGSEDGAANFRQPASVLQVHRQADRGRERAGEAAEENARAVVADCAGHWRDHRLGNFRAHRHCGRGRIFSGAVHSACAGAGSDRELPARRQHGERAHARPPGGWAIHRHLIFCWSPRPAASPACAMPNWPR